MADDGGDTIFIREIKRTTRHLKMLRQWELIDNHQRMGRQVDLDDHIEEWELMTEADG